MATPTNSPAAPNFSLSTPSSEAHVAAGMSLPMDEHIRLLQGRSTYEERMAENDRLLNTAAAEERGLG